MIEVRVWNEMAVFDKQVGTVSFYVQPRITCAYDATLQIEYIDCVPFSMHLGR
jgi:hypothetical protein